MFRRVDYHRDGSDSVYYGIEVDADSFDALGDVSVTRTILLQNALSMAMDYP